MIEEQINRNEGRDFGGLVFFLWGEGVECSPQELAPLKNFQKIFFGSGCGVVLNGWGVLVIRGDGGVGTRGICGRCCFGGDLVYLHILYDVKNVNYILPLDMEEIIARASASWNVPRPFVFFNWTVLHESG